jgi:hypothetical protein
MNQSPVAACELPAARHLLEAWWNLRFCNCGCWMPRMRCRTEKEKKVCEWVSMPEAGWWVWVLRESDLYITQAMLRGLRNGKVRGLP